MPTNEKKPGVVTLGEHGQALMDSVLSDWTELTVAEVARLETYCVLADTVETMRQHIEKHGQPSKDNKAVNTAYLTEYRQSVLALGNFLASWQPPHANAGSAGSAHARVASLSRWDGHKRAMRAVK